MRRIGHHIGLRFIVTALVIAAVTFVLIVSLGDGAARGSGRKSSQAGESRERPTMSAEERATRFQAGEPWQGKGQHQGISQEEAERFPDYPLLWLGERFAGYNLQAIVRQKYDPPAGIPAHEAMNSVGFAYGDCTIPEGGRACPVPLVVMIEPACLTRPESIATGMRAGPLESVRGGAQLLRFRDGHVRLWTGRVSISIDAPVDPALVDQALQELRGLNVALPVSAPLAPPDFSGCPAVEIPPLQGLPD